MTRGEAIRRAQAVRVASARQRREAFARYWNAAATVAEVCERFGMTANAARKRAWRARQSGLHLKHHTPSRLNVVLDTLEGSPVALPAVLLARRAGVDATTARQHLNTLAEAGKATRNRRGFWMAA